MNWLYSKGNKNNLITTRFFWLLLFCLSFRFNLTNLSLQTPCDLQISLISIKLGCAGRSSYSLCSAAFWLFDRVFAKRSATNCHRGSESSTWMVSAAKSEQHLCKHITLYVVLRIFKLKLNIFVIVVQFIKPMQLEARMPFTKWRVPVVCKNNFSVHFSGAGFVTEIILPNKQNIAYSLGINEIDGVTKLTFH